MADGLRVRLHNVSVVVTAEFHNPSILNPDFLASHGIVPADWTVADTLTTPPVSVVKYENGIAWTVDQSRLTVTENCGPKFQDSYRIHALVNAYLEKLPHVPYRALGLNCQVSTLQPDPRSWLFAQFASDWLHNDSRVRGMKPAFALDTVDAVCNIAFAGATRDNSPCVFAECNVHHRGRLDVAGLRAAIARWAERQEFVASKLDWLFEEFEE
jgi:hypothetical protein